MTSYLPTQNRKEMAATTVKVENEVCVLCNSAESDLFLPEEYDAGAPRTLPPMKSMLLHLAHNKPLPNGRICGNCAQRAVDAYEFSSQISSNTTQPLSEKIRELRKRLHELTQKIDVFIVVGAGSEGGYQEEDIIMVQKDKLAAAVAADKQRANKWLREEYQCSVCPKSFKSAEQLSSHLSSHSPMQRHSCWSCGTQFSSRQDLETHRTQHCVQQQQNLTCHLCTEDFESENLLASHQELCPCVCPLCGAAFISRAELAAHARELHAGTLPALCADCFYVSHTEEERSSHAVSHRASSHYVCGADGCLLRFQHRTSLTAHVRKAHGAKPRPTTPINTGGVMTRSTRSAHKPKQEKKVESTSSTVDVELESTSAYLSSGSPITGHEPESPAKEDDEQIVEYLEMDTFDDD